MTTEEGLKAALQGDQRKIKIALRLRRETMMTFEWTAKRLSMGTKTHLSHLLYWHAKTKAT